MAFIDYYNILGVEKNASVAEIKKAYRKLARKHHPDVNPSDKQSEKKFKEINEANEVLSNSENRKKYDKYGKDWQHAEQFENQKQQQRQSYNDSPGGYSDFGGSFAGSDFSDFFESMFGTGGAETGREGKTVFKGQDYNAELHLDLKDAFTTHKQTLKINGKNIRITIPAGVENGQVIKIPSLGGDGINGGHKGDLYITFIIKNATHFKLNDHNLFCDIELDLYKAVLGGEITISTFDGKVKLKVKSGTQTGTRVKLKGKGFPFYKKEGLFGDLYISYQVKLPTNLTDKEKELFKQLSNLRT